MTDQITPAAFPSTGTGIGDVKIETNYTESAPVEQQSTESAKEQPLEVAESVADVPVTEAATVAPAEDKTAQVARDAIRERLRAEDAERRLREMQPKSAVPIKQPDINDQKSWGDKYKDAPNDYETFLKAHADWAMEEGRRSEREAFNQAKAQQEQLAIRTEVAKKEQESRVKHADYDTVINQVAPIIGTIPILKDFIARNAMGTEVAYELGKNPVVLEQLMRSNVWDAGEQLLNMAARLKAPKVAEITKAPEPITPIGSRETVRPRLAELAAKDVGAYINQQNKAELARKRRIN
ncbi:unnamed protein product [Sphagnum jensenii]